MPKKRFRSLRRGKAQLPTEQSTATDTPEAEKTRAASLVEQQKRDSFIVFFLRRQSFWLRITVSGVVAIAVIYVISVTLGSFASSVALAVLGIIGSWLSNKIEVSQVASDTKILSWTPGSWLGVAFLSIILFQVVELAMRLWFIPFRIHYGASFYLSRTAIGGAILMDWTGFVLCGCLIGYLMPARALSAAIIGATMFLGMNIIEAYTGAANYSNFIFLGSMIGIDPDEQDFELYRLGLIAGLVVRGILVVLVARYVSRRRIRQGLVYK
jgi:hypothetical protein